MTDSTKQNAEQGHKPMMRNPRRKVAFFSVTFVAVAAATVAAALLFGWHEDRAFEYRMVGVERGPLVSTVTASGTLAAVVTVQVGSQISGQIKEIYADFNSEVKAGELIARLDPATYEAKLKQAEANLRLAQASVKTQQAAVAKARATQANTEKSLKRQRDLARQGVASASAFDNAEAAFNQAQAELNMAQAQVENAQAQVGAQEALVHQARIDLERTYIRAPVNGTVISRDVDRGQTVAASLQAPVLFKIAQDLRKMQVEVRVDEADVGRIQQGQRATFTVDSFPGREFHGRVEQIRKASTVVQNVVTYSVLVSAANDDLRLLPGLTANVRVVVDERPEVLKIANAALRFRPPGVTDGATPVGVPRGSAPGGAIAGEPPGARQTAGQGNAQGERLAQLTRLLELTPDQQQQVKSMIADSRINARAQRQARQGEGSAESGTGRGAAQQIRAQFDAKIAAILTPVQLEKYRTDRESRSASGTRPGRVWVMGEDGQPRAVDVTLGITDGVTTEIMRGELAEGHRVIVGMASTAGGAGRSSSRSLPSIGR